MIQNFEKIFFIGLGGAGQRHLRIYRSLLPNTKFFGFRKTSITPTLNSDFTVDKENTLNSKYDIEITTDLEKIDDINPQLTIISVPNKFHYLYSEIAFNSKSNVFVEKPGCISKKEVQNLIKLQNKTKLSFRVGYQRKYHPLYELIKRYINLKTFGNLKKIFINVSSFIPDWHPYENFKSLYACQEKLGGGILTTECHEINMILELFGKPLKSNFLLKNKCNEIKSVYDSAMGYMNYSSFDIELDISFYRKPTKREIIFQFEQSSLFWDIDGQTLNSHNGENKNLDLSFNLKNDDLFILQAIDVLKLNPTDTLKDLNNLEIYTSLLDNNNNN